MAVLLCCTSGSPVPSNQPEKVSIDIFCLFFKPVHNYCWSWIYLSPTLLFPNKVEDFTADIGDAREESKETEVDQNKRTQLFEVLAQPGVDRSDTLHDSKQVIFSFLLSALIFQKKNTMYIWRDDI